MQDPAHTGDPLASSDDRDRIRAARVITWLSFSGTVFLFAIGLRSAWSGDIVHAQVLFAFGAILLLNELIYRTSGNLQRQRARRTAISIAPKPRGGTASIPMCAAPASSKHHNRFQLTD